MRATLTKINSNGLKLYSTKLRRIHNGKLQGYLLPKHWFNMG